MSKLLHKRNWKVDNEYETPPEIWDEILPFLPKDKVCWMPFYCTGFSGDYLAKKGIKILHRYEDFWIHNRGDYVCDNPPYMLPEMTRAKKKIMERLKFLNKPFMLLLPSSTIQTVYFKELFDEHIQLIIPSRQYQFFKDGILTHNCPFYTLWVCWRMNFEKDLTIL